MCQCPAGRVTLADGVALQMGVPRATPSDGSLCTVRRKWLRGECTRAGVKLGASPLLCVAPLVACSLGGVVSPGVRSGVASVDLCRVVSGEEDSLCLAPSGEGGPPVAGVPAVRRPDSGCAAIELREGV